MLQSDLSISENAGKHAYKHTRPGIRSSVSCRGIHLNHHLPPRVYRSIGCFILTTSVRTPFHRRKPVFQIVVFSHAVRYQCQYYPPPQNDRECNFARSPRESLANGKTGIARDSIPILYLSRDARSRDT